MPKVFEDPASYAKSWVAELLGTFFLLLLVLLAPPALTFVAAGAMLLVLVVAIGSVSGAHVNPAVTAGLVAAGKFPLIDGLLYVGAQFFGAISAVAMVAVLGRPLPSVEAGGGAFAFEMLGAFLLVFVVTQVTVKGVPETGSALAVGIALALGVLMAAPISGGVLNPAIGLTLLLTGIIQSPFPSVPTYLFAPIAGGLLAGLLGKYLGGGTKPGVDGDEPGADEAPAEPRTEVVSQYGQIRVHAARHSS